MQRPEHRARQKGNIVSGFRRAPRDPGLQPEYRCVGVISLWGAWVKPEANSTTAFLYT
jgi:hypothetical protein